ncbi:TolC family protein [Thermodesulfatator atlanticus]|uniref:TolC family protein n=1 Tax=Thermodesulfatator atlanticus TaxID=501497 RepID=UPI0003B79DC4|nr:TolC family protein [Thermodesulfatator atlanticus]
MRKFLIILLLCWGLSHGLAMAQEKLTLEACLKEALSENPNLEMLKARIKAAESMAQAAKQERWPTLAARYSYLHLRDQQKVVIMGQDFPLSSHENIEFDFLFNFPVFHGFSLRIKEKLRKLDVELASFEYERAVSRLIFEVNKAYYDVLKAKRGVIEARKSLKRLESHLETAKAYYAQGLIAKHQVLESEVAYAQAEHALIVAQNILDLAKGKLNVLLNRPVNAAIDVEDILSEKPKLEAFETYLEKALSRRPEIKAVLLATEKARQNVRLAKSAYYPWVDLKAIYQKKGIDLLASRNPYGDRENIFVGFEINWLIWDWGARKSKVSAARAKVLEEEASLRDLKNRISLEVRAAYLDVQAAQKKLKVAERALRSAEENFRLNEARFKEGLATTTDVLDAEAFLTSARVRRIEALADLKTAYARLLYAAGINQGPLKAETP